MGGEDEYGLFFPGMDIPKSCVGCPAVYYELIALAYNPDETTKTKIWCRSAKREVVEVNEETGKPDWCPARCLRWKIVQDYPTPVWAASAVRYRAAKVCWRTLRDTHGTRNSTSRRSTR